MSTISYPSDTPVLSTRTSLDYGTFPMCQSEAISRMNDFCRTNGLRSQSFKHKRKYYARVAKFTDEFRCVEFMIKLEAQTFSCGMSTRSDYFLYKYFSKKLHAVLSDPSDDPHIKVDLPTRPQSIHPPAKATEQLYVICKLNLSQEYIEAKMRAAQLWPHVWELCTDDDDFLLITKGLINTCDPRCIYISISILNLRCTKCDTLSRKLVTENNKDGFVITLIHTISKQRHELGAPLYGEIKIRLIQTLNIILGTRRTGRGHPTEAPESHAH